MNVEMIELNPPERKRTYFFPGSVVVLENVTHFLASITTHRLKTKDGKIHIVPISGWIHIEIDAENFTV